MSALSFFSGSFRRRKYNVVWRARKPERLGWWMAQRRPGKHLPWRTTGPLASVSAFEMLKGRLSISHPTRLIMTHQDYSMFLWLSLGPKCMWLGFEKNKTLWCLVKIRHKNFRKLPWCLVLKRDVNSVKVLCEKYMVLHHFNKSSETDAGGFTLLTH